MVLADVEESVETRRQLPRS